MNKNAFETLAETFLDEARALLTLGKNGGAYYLAGYTVECALKACLAKKTAAHDFPPKPDVVKDYYQHNLERLLTLSGLQPDLANQGDSDLTANWGVVKSWNEQSRYERKAGTEAKELIEAIADPNHGVLKWIKAYW